VGGSSLFFILNADWRAQTAKLPSLADGKRWYRLIDTSLAPGDDFLEEGREIVIDPPSYYVANARSTVLLLGK
ncbi:MAG: glycogen debranching enzyme GlgX, partial [Deltaproteobacteria bacterium]|nr:glycogen debranching enzyme GlgX [Deltaproteobacteria bacterium]